MLLLFALPVLFALWPPLNAAAEWKQEEFILGTFWDPCLSRVTAAPYPPDSVRQDSIRFARAREAHINLLTGTQQEPWNVSFSPGGMRYALYIAAKTGLHYLVADPRFHGYREIPPWNSEAHRGIVRDYVTSLDSLRRSALYGYNVADEPCIDPNSADHDCASNARRYRDWQELLRSDDPDRLVYVNLLNAWAHDDRVDGLSDEAYFRSYFDDEEPARRADVVSTDDYPFSADYGFNKQYFENLATMRRVAGTRPMWVYPMVASSNHQEDTTWERLLFMTMCPLAYGAKGLIYFTYENPEWDGEFVVHGSPVLDCDSLTSRYYELQRVNRYIRDVLGPVIMRADHRGAYHTGVTAWEEWLQPVDMLAAGGAKLVRSAENPNVVVGEFQDASDPATWYLLVVNKSLERQTVGLELQPGVRRIEMAIPLERFEGEIAYTELRPGANPETGQFWLMLGDELALDAGEGRLFRISDVP